MGIRKKGFWKMSSMSVHGTMKKHNILLQNLWRQAVLAPRCMLSGIPHMHNQSHYEPKEAITTLVPCHNSYSKVIMYSVKITLNFM
jgi:hypothetical protein